MFFEDFFHSVYIMAFLFVLLTFCWEILKWCFENDFFLKIVSHGTGEIVQLVGCWPVLVNSSASPFVWFSRVYLGLGVCASKARFKVSQLLVPDNEVEQECQQRVNSITRQLIQWSLSVTWNSQSLILALLCIGIADLGPTGCLTVAIALPHLWH